MSFSKKPNDNLLEIVKRISELSGKGNTGQYLSILPDFTVFSLANIKESMRSLPDLNLLVL